MPQKDICFGKIVRLAYFREEFRGERETMQMCNRLETDAPSLFAGPEFGDKEYNLVI
jgi:hypothetical protein